MFAPASCLRVQLILGSMEYSMSTEIKTLTSISQADAQSWNALTDGAPILSHAFLSALEETGCVGHRTGW
ncbi:MAG: peptidogalycan biosysnthesis protein, partial [Candidatus Methylopumilus sp.]